MLSIAFVIVNAYFRKKPDIKYPVRLRPKRLFTLPVMPENGLPKVDLRRKAGFYRL